MARSRLAAILFASPILVSACTTLARMSAPSLEGSPETTGVVVVQADVTVHDMLFGLKSGAAPVGGVIASVDGTKHVVHGKSTSDLVVFSNLPPGRWQLVMIEADWQSGNATWRKEFGVPIENIDAFTFDVRAGEPVYLGAKIEEDPRSDAHRLRFDRHDEPAAERKAWQWLDEVYEKSAWAPVFRAKLGSPEAHPEAASAPKAGS